MRIMQIIRSGTLLFLWSTVAIGSGIAAYDAARYAALTFHYYYGQHCLLEPIVQHDAASVNPANEGKLVQVSGRVVSDHILRDPVYGAPAEGVRMERQVTGLPCTIEGGATADAPARPPEPHLASWRSTTPARIGSYVLEGPGVHRLPLLYGERPVLSVMSLPPELRDQAEIVDKCIVLPSINGFRYRVKFILYKPKEAFFVGRQRGNSLISDQETMWRTEFITERPRLPLYKALLNTGFFSLMAWAAAMLALYSLNNAVRSRMPFRELARNALLLSIITTLSIYGILLDKGVLWSDPTWDMPRRRVERVFVQDTLLPSRVAAVHACLWLGMGLCLVLAWAPYARRLRARFAKKP